MAPEEWRPKMRSESLRCVHLRNDGFVPCQELRPNRVGRDLVCHGGGRTAVRVLRRAPRVVRPASSPPRHSRTAPCRPTASNPGASSLQVHPDDSTVPA